MPSIRDFSSGVLNQELQNRDQGAGVLFDCKNVLSSWNGELRKRTGTAWLATLPEYQRIIPYRMPNGDDIILLLAENRIVGYEFAGENAVKPFYVFSGTKPTFPTSGWDGVVTNGDYTIWLSSGSDDTEWGRGFDEPVKTRPMTYYGKGALWSGGYGSTTNIPAYIQISSTNPQLLSSLRIRWTNTCSGNHPGHYKGWLSPTIQYSDDGTNWTSVQTSMSNPLPTGGAGYYSASYHYGLGSSEKTENYVFYKVTNVDHSEKHRYWRVYCAQRITNTQTYSGERIDLNVSNIEYMAETKTHLVIDTSADFQINEDNIENIKFAQSDDLMILANGTDDLFYLQYASGSMSSGSYVTTFDSQQGTPSCVCFYQNRLWLGGFSAFPTRVWGSAFGNFTDFTIPQTVLATSAISADSVEIKSRIENMWGGNNALYCLSEDGISMIDAQGGIVATNQIEFKLRNREPTDNMTPTYKDDIMMYLGRDKRKILITDYDLVVQRFRANNISENYTDFLLSGVRELHYIPDRHSLIYGLLQNGSWFTLLFDVTKGKNALYPFDTNGSVLDIQPLKYGDKTRLVMIIQREGIYMLEEKLFSVDQEIMDFMTEEEKENYTKDVVNSQNGYLDCLVQKTYEEPTTTVSNIPYPANANVVVIADGMYLGEKTLTSGITGGLYAWANGDNVVYTDSTTPSVDDIIFDKYQEAKSGYSIIAVAPTNITVHYTKQTTQYYYGYKRINTITVTSTDSSHISGQFVRYEAGDTEVQNTTRTGTVRIYHGSAWIQGTKVIYTVSTDLKAGSYFTDKTSGTNILSSNKTVVSIDSETQIYTITSTPVVGNDIYDDQYSVLGQVESINEYGIIYDNKEFNRNATEDKEATTEEVVEEPFYRNSALDISQQSVSLELEEPATNVVMGYSYDSYAVLKFISPYTERKFPKEIAVNFINSGYLEVGNTFDSLKSVLNNLVESVSISNKRILMNGNYAKTLDKHAFETPYVIVRSDKGLPFIITGIDYKVDMSNYQGGV